MSENGVDTLLIGIDAACRSVLEPQFEAGSLPAPRSIVDGGVSSPLESQLPPWTPSAWASLYTGVNPGKHGVYSFLEYEGYDWDVVDANCVRANTLWELLDHRDRSSVVVNVPVTSPPPAIDGAVVPGFVAPENPPCHPSGLLDDLRAELGEYRLYGEHEFDDNAPVGDRIREYRSLVALRGAAFRHLVDRFDPDFGFVQFQQTDTVVHDYPGDERALHAVYGAVDDEIAAILDAVDPDAVFVASDHGIGPYEGREFRVNEFLREEGFLETTRSGGATPSWVPIWRDDLQNGSGADGSSNGRVTDESVVHPPSTDGGTAASGVRSGTAEFSLQRACRNVLSRTGLTVDRLVSPLERLGVAAVVGRYAPDAVLDALEPGRSIDFANSVAYLRLPVELGVRLNVEGREPDGVVTPEEYDDVRAALVRALRDARTPDGEPVFESVEPREAVYEGPHLDSAPDVVTVPAGFDEFPAARLADGVFGPLHEPWNHKPDGIFAAAGPAIDGDASIDGAHLLDVAPTILSTLGVPVDERMDGRTLGVTRQSGRHRYPEPERDGGGGRYPGDRSAGNTVTDRLGSLGYIGDS